MTKIVRRSFGILFGSIVLLYLALLLIGLGDDGPMEARNVDTSLHGTIAIFGATGTIGDGLLKAAMNDPDTDKIYVVTRRPSPRIEEGVASGRVTMMIHKDYQDYSGIAEVLSEVDTVFWAIGLSAVGLDEETYREIHADYPLSLVDEWLDASNKTSLSFHYVSGSAAKLDSRMMWAREKARAEAELTKLAAGSSLRAVSYRPFFILPTEAELHFGHRVLYAIFSPIKLAVTAQSIGDAMLEVSARGQQVPNGAILENADILGYSQAYESRLGKD